ncbi:hypothetical protein EVAR_82119_1 [Eumeta japonica]|uniref:Uncharacterized protein n=1 Tax=Eumeta variegata TaxID=151549 RepID=A0A4C1U331_EUMVA|nr:hypothetical protein EVAR_82119_1 [Eumeta japonica]
MRNRRRSGYPGDQRNKSPGFAHIITFGYLVYFWHRPRIRHEAEHALVKNKFEKSQPSAHRSRHSFKRINSKCIELTPVLFRFEIRRLYGHTEDEANKLHATPSIMLTLRGSRGRGDVIFVNEALDGAPRRRVGGDPLAECLSSPWVDQNMIYAKRSSPKYSNLFSQTNVL